MTEPVPQEIAEALADCSPSARATLLEIRDMIFDTAAKNERIGPLTETLKWGQPAYLTEKTKSGSTIRLGQTRDTGEPALFVICNTNLVEQFKQHYADTFVYEGKRALVPGTLTSGKKKALAHCIAMALTYRI